MTYFGYLHPLTRALYFLLLFICLMVVFDPLALALALAAALLRPGLRRRRAAMGSGRFLAVLAASIILINFAFNHRGTHVLFYAFDRPMTLEALFYGVTSALLILCILAVFQNAADAISTAEFLYLFKGAAPELGLLVSMTCGSFQTLMERGEEIRTAVRMKDIDILSGTLRERSLAGMQIMNVLIALTLENALMTVLSMKTRAFELRGRSCGTIYRMRARDIFFIAASAALAALVIFTRVSGLHGFTVYPSIETGGPGAALPLFYAAFTLLLALPHYKSGAYSRKLALQKEGSR